MSRIILLFGIIALAAGLTAAGKTRRKDCVKNEEFLKCGPTCPQTCDNLGTENCGGKCKRGCFCRKGYVRTKRGDCVKASKKCCTGKHETFSKCAPRCEPTCANPTKKCKGCEMKCRCKQGYVRTPKGKCVHIDKCPPWSCPNDNEQFLKCGKALECVPSCANPTPPTNCAKVCVRGCYCVKDYVRNSEGLCIKPETCPTLIECIAEWDSDRK